VWNEPLTASGSASPYPSAEPCAELTAS
jgi:hypothetical protein